MPKSSAVTLPSGSTISRETWDALKARGRWRDVLDPHMYSPADREYLDREIFNPFDIADDDPGDMSLGDYDS
jgi:hypothetical protein